MDNLMKYLEKYVSQNEEAFFDDLCNLIRIPSVLGEAEANAPYGRYPAQALEAATALFEREGLRADRYTQDGYSLCTQGETGKKIGLFYHCDVVPPNGEWLFSEPFEPTFKDGLLIGRGVYDDKGGIVTGLYALRALRDYGYKFHNKIQVFLGSNEETGMADGESYVKQHTPPDVSISPDTDFTMERGEKADVRFYAVAQQAFENIIDFSGGDCSSSVCAEVTVTLRGSNTLREQLTSVLEGRADASLAQENNDVLLLSVTGITGHSSRPEGSHNAAAVAAEILMQCPAIGENDLNILRTLFDLLDGWNGELFGISYEDNVFGPLTSMSGIIRTIGGKIRTYIICKHNDTIVNADTVLSAIRDSLEKRNWGIEDIEITRGFLADVDNPLVQAIYQQCLAVCDTGRPIFGARGETYSHLMKNSFAVGVEVPSTILPDWYPAAHGRRHQPDECARTENLLRGIILTARILVSLDQFLYANG